MIYGIDVSKHQGQIDWDAVKAAHTVGWPGTAVKESVGFAIIKATGEETAGDKPFKDSRFDRNWREAKRVGMRRGAYHFLDAGAGSAPGKAEAEFFIRAIEESGGWQEDEDLLPVVDVEWPPKGGHAADIEQLADYIEMIERYLGAMPIVYTGRWWWDTIKDKDLAWWCGDGRPLWLASYTATLPTPPKPWDRVSIWQFTDKGAVRGILGPVDLNRMLVPIGNLMR